MTESPDKPKLNAPEAAIVPVQLLDDIRYLIQLGRDRIAQTVNMELVLLYWHIGDRIHREILGEERAGYCEKVVGILSKIQTTEFGRGFSHKSLIRTIRFAEIFQMKQLSQHCRDNLPGYIS
jgi:DUF1016 N-terminal domain